MQASDPIEFKSRSIAVVSALVRSADLQTLADALERRLGATPDFFDDELAVLDFTALEATPESVDWIALCELLRRYRLQPIGVRHVPPQWRDAARDAGLVTLPDQEQAARPRPEPPPPPAAEPEPPPAPAFAAGEAAPTLIIDRPLRSGQQVYARGGDLVVLAMVSAGAEVIADGSIHVYAPLRGRALAGARGEEGARIFATAFQPELVSIAGVWRNFEQALPAELAGQAAQVRLVGDEDGQQRLSIEPLALR